MSKFCPTCHSKVSEDQSLLANRRQGAVSPGIDNLPDVILSSNPDIIPLWTDDPIRNPDGFNGEEFIGLNKLSSRWIRELQTVRRNEEIEVGIPEDSRTNFSEINGQKVSVRHITELRQSIEKIIDASGFTLSEYFSKNQDGENAEANPNDVADKAEWTDVSRGAPYTASGGESVTSFELPSGVTQESPTFPRGAHIKTVHIEDLRHPIQAGWREFWSVTPEEEFYNSDVNDNNFGFELNGLEPQPTDVGSVYEEDGNKLWLLRVSNNSGSGTDADTRLTILDTTDTDILNSKNNSNILRIESDIFINAFTASPASSVVGFRHNFNDSSGPFPLTNRVISFTKDSHFKIYVKQNGTVENEFNAFSDRPNISIELNFKLEGFTDSFIVTIVLNSKIEAGNLNVQQVNSGINGALFKTLVSTTAPTLENFLNADHQIFIDKALEYDLAINVDDYLEAIKSYEISSVPVGNFFNYVSHKKLENGNITSNPDGTRVTVNYVELSYLEDRVGLESQPGQVKNRIVDVTGIRIENNDNTIRS